MVSRDEDRIDFDRLEVELNAAVESDARYNRENDAKFRAVHQKVATYDEFKEIVAAAHLKPLEKGDRLDQVEFRQLWNVHGAPMQCGQTTDTATPLNATSFEKIPANGHEFARDWRRQCKTCSDKHDFLLWLGARNLGKVFKAEISLGLLGDIITALLEGYQCRHLVQTYDILRCLSEANRFSLSVQFMSDAEHEQCQRLFEHIKSDLQGQSEASVKACDEEDASVSETKVLGESAVHSNHRLVTLEEVQTLQELYATG